MTDEFIRKMLREASGNSSPVRKTRAELTAKKLTLLRREIERIREDQSLFDGAKTTMIESMENQCKQIEELYKRQKADEAK